MPITKFIITPLAYIEAGAESRQLGNSEPVVDGSTALVAFLDYCQFMKTQFHTISAVNRRGEDASKAISFPMQVDSFLLFCGMGRGDWETLKGDPINVADCSFIEMAIEAQQNEGGLIGEYASKMVQLLQDRKDKVEVSGTLSIEQITGMEVR